MGTGRHRRRLTLQVANPSPPLEGKVLSELFKFDSRSEKMVLPPTLTCRSVQKQDRTQGRRETEEAAVHRNPGPERWTLPCVRSRRRGRSDSGRGQVPVEPTKTRPTRKQGTPGVTVVGVTW